MANKAEKTERAAALREVSTYYDECEHNADCAAREADEAVSDIDIPSTQSPQLLATFWRGVTAYRDGEPLSACPYYGGNRGFASAYKTYWHRGWREAARVDREEFAK